jgi:hypothetical protein
MQDGATPPAPDQFVNQSTHWGSMVLPYIDQAPAYNSMKWGSYPTIWDTGPNLLARQTKMQVLICPSSGDFPQYNQVDNGGNAVSMGIPMGNDIAPCNYGVVASGTIGNPAGPRPTESNNHMDDGSPPWTHARFDGTFVQNLPYRIRDVVDGTSTTAGIGERCRNALTIGDNNRFRQYFCIGSPNAQNQHSSFSGSIGTTLNSTATTYGYAGYQSQHEGGVQFLLLDGAVRFISENLDDRVRLALGTRNGNDVVGEF